MKIAILLSLAFLINTSYAKLPSWVKNTCELTAYEFLTKEMVSGPFYKIKNITSTEVVSPSGHQTIETILKFDDSNNCNDREVIVDCFAPAPQSDRTLVVQEILIDCMK